MDSEYQWLDLDSIDMEHSSRVRSAIEEFVRDHPDAGMDHDLTWLSAKCDDDKSVKIYVCRDQQGDVVGYAPFFVHPSALSFELFGISLFYYRVRRYSITATPLIAPHHPAPTALIEALLLKMRDSLRSREVVFGLGVELDSNFGRVLCDCAALRKTYRVMPFGTSYRHRLIALPDRFEKYVEGLGKSTRYEARRALRRFESDKEIGGTYRVFATPEDLPDFLRLATTVSEKTYQHKLLGMGIADNDTMRRMLALAAERGWFRSMIVMFGNEPVAFKYGYFFNGTYYSELVGYDPRCAPYSVGTVAHLLTVRDLIGAGAKTFDFKYGDHGNKERLSNCFREEQNIYLIPRRFPLSALATALHAFNATSDWTGNLLEKFGLKSRIRKFLRRLSGRLAS